MRVCLICTEFFGRGVYGGFGRATRFIGRELSRRNVEVTAIVPVRDPARPGPAVVDGMRIVEFRPRAFLSSLELYRQVDADIYHSQDPSLSTWLAMRAMPHRRHVITFRDPLDADDWRIEFAHSGTRWPGLLAARFYIDNFLVRSSVRRADARFCAAPFLASKVRIKYGIDEPRHLATPVEIPVTATKAPAPTVCSVGRWHRRKRPERVLALARRFPAVKFVMVGGTNDASYEAELRREGESLPNVEMTGVIDQFESDRLQEILSSSWILVNTAAREGLPITFLEAAAHGCAILSGVDPDGFASRFGHSAADDDFERGLQTLLDNDRWIEAGQRGRAHVSATNATQIAIGRHVEEYRRLLEPEVT